MRDASDNTKTVYNQSTAGVLTQREVNLYGSILLGVQKRNIDADAAMLNLSAVGQRGMKQYFLGNHLGNTLAIISDKKYAAVIMGGVVTAYVPDIVSATDYSSFGVSLLGRQINISNVEYGFNGKWNEVETGYQNYGMRDYDARTRRFTSVDPLTKKYPELTPYQFASNRPIDGIDQDGLEYIPYIPKFQYSGNKTLTDYVSAVDNGVINVLNVPATFWNGLVSSATSLAKGTYTKDLFADTKRFGNSMKQTAKTVADNPIKAITSPEAVEFATSLYAGSKLPIPTVKGEVGFLSPNTAANVEENVTIYRGVNETHIGYEDALNGIVKPNGGNATPLEHNTVSTLNSPYTSWTTDENVAINYALRPKGNGVVLEKTVPKSSLIKSPNTKIVQLKQNPSQIVSESEVLFKGKVTGATVKKTLP